MDNTDVHDDDFSLGHPFTILYISYSLYCNAWIAAQVQMHTPASIIESFCKCNAVVPQQSSRLIVERLTSHFMRFYIVGENRMQKKVSLSFEQQQQQRPLAATAKVVVFFFIVAPIIGVTSCKY